MMVAILTLPARQRRRSMGTGRSGCWTCFWPVPPTRRARRRLPLRDGHLQCGNFSTALANAVSRCGGSSASRLLAFNRCSHRRSPRRSTPSFLATACALWPCRNRSTAARQNASPFFLTPRTFAIPAPFCPAGITLHVSLLGFTTYPSLSSRYRSLKNGALRRHSKRWILAPSPQFVPGTYFAPMPRARLD